MSDAARPSPAVPADPPQWLAGTRGQWRLRFAVQPGAPRTEVVGVHDGCLKLRVAAPPVDGRANEEVLRWLAKRLAVPRAQLRIVSGESARRKSVAVDAALDAAALVAALSYQGRDPHSAS